MTVRNFFSIEVDDFYINVLFIDIVNFVECACLDQVSAHLFLTWVAKSHQRGLD